MEMEEGKEDGGEQAEGQEEGQAARPLPQPRMPSRKLVEEHELTHIPYRSWCVHCRRARGIAAPHRSSEEETKEGKEGAISSWSMDYTFLTEDFELLTRTKAEEYAYKDNVKDTVLVSTDRKTGGIKAHLVQCKGLGVDGFQPEQWRTSTILGTMEWTYASRRIKSQQFWNCRRKWLS